MADTKTLMIQGREFTAPFKYSAGHTLTEVEAKVLNQTRFENLRNNFAPIVKKSLEGAEGAVPEAELDSKFAEYEAGYDFAMPGAGGGSRALDPIEKEARSIATAIVKEKLRAAGKSWTAPKEASDEDKAAYRGQIDAKVEEVAAREEVIAAARKNVADRQKSLDKISANLEL